jgi:hypothetical protein
MVRDSVLVCVGVGGGVIVGVTVLVSVAVTVMLLVGVNSSVKERVVEGVGGGESVAVIESSLVLDPEGLKKSV